jgi:hypothetical protein
MCPLSSVPFQALTAPVGLVICGVAPPPLGVSLPHACPWGLALIPRSSLRSRPHDRPHVSIAETFRSALAACGIPPTTPCGWSLLMAKHERWQSMRARVRFHRSQFSLVASVGRCVPPGCSAGQTGQCLWLPAPSPVPFWLQQLSLLRWVSVTMAPHTFACAAQRCLLNGIPGRGDQAPPCIPASDR